jgi:hypothetical protein
MIFWAPLVMVAYTRKHSQTIVLVSHQTELDVNENLHQAPVILRTMDIKNLNRIFHLVKTPSVAQKVYLI